MVAWFHNCTQLTAVIAILDRKDIIVQVVVLVQEVQLELTLISEQSIITSDRK